jgi:hypothetical protein
MAPDAAYARIWGRWIGREAELFRECARLAAGLSWEQVLGLGGAPARLGATVVGQFFERMSLERPLPERLERGPAVVQIGRRAGEARVRNASSPHDALDVPASVIDAAQRIAGVPLAALRAEGASLDEAMIRRLMDWELLVSA